MISSSTAKLRKQHCFRPIWSLLSFLTTQSEKNSWKKLGKTSDEFVIGPEKASTDSWRFQSTPGLTELGKKVFFSFSYVKYMAVKGIPEWHWFWGIKLSFHCGFLLFLFADSYFILQISHVKNFKMWYIMGLYNNYIQDNS